MSPAINVITDAIVQVEEVIQKNAQSLELLKTNLQQLSIQKIALAAQAALLKEIKAKIETEESKDLTLK